MHWKSGRRGRQAGRQPLVPWWIPIVRTVRFSLRDRKRRPLFYPIASATISSSRNGITPTYMTPSSSVHGLLLPSSTTILRKKSPVFLKEKVSCAFFSGVSTCNADWIYSLSLPTLTTKSILYCDERRRPSMIRVSSTIPTSTEYPLRIKSL